MEKEKPQLTTSPHFSRSAKKRSAIALSNKEERPLKIAKVSLDQKLCVSSPTSSSSPRTSQSKITSSFFSSPKKAITTKATREPPKKRKVTTQTNDLPIPQITPHMKTENLEATLQQFALTKKTPSPPTAPVKHKKANIKPKDKYTPLESQVMQLWKENPGVLLAIEVGYRFMFLGDDGVKASKTLHFILAPAKGNSHFPHCSVPAATLHVHLHRLVNAGHKVGVVTQSETKALKKVNNRNTPFTRIMSQVYTKGTFISPKIDQISEKGSISSRNSGASDSGYLFCFCEAPGLSPSTSSDIEIAIIAVNISTGEIIWDNFKDDFLRTGLENRLASIRPTELILPESANLTEQSQQLMQQYFSKNNINHVEAEGDPKASYDYDNSSNSVRIDRYSFRPKELLGIAEAFFKQKIEELKNTFGESSTSIFCCLGAMIRYLRDFSLENVFELLSNFKPFTEDNHVPLDRCAIEQLEILENIDGTAKQNLLWLIDLTETHFGSRLLTYWLLHPVKDIHTINERLDSVQELVERPGSQSALKTALSGLPDLERGLARLFYHKCEPLEFISIMRSFLSIFKSLPSLHAQLFTAPLLRRTVDAIPNLCSEVESWLSCLRVEAAKDKNSFTNLFQFEHLPEDPYPNIKAIKAKIERLQESLNEILAQTRNDTGFPNLKYKSILNEGYLIELTNKQSESVPNNWLLVNKTKSAKRYRTPATKGQYEILCQQKELLAACVSGVWRQFVDQCKKHYYDLRSVLVHLAVLDCLYSFSIRGSRVNYVRPTLFEPMNDNDAKIIIRDGRHPILEESKLDNSVVPNNTNLENTQRFMMLTGPNMGGKSCYIKQVALIVLLAQIGSFVPASFAEISPVDRIMVRMGAQDSLEQGKSTFFIEMQETSEILQHATSRSLVILDELGRGTSTFDGVSIADATLRYLITNVKCFTLFVTHYHLLCETASQFPAVASCYHMGFFQDVESQCEDSEYSITFLYELTKGMANKSYGLNVAKLASIPDEIIHGAARKSQELEKTLKLIDKSSDLANISAIQTLLALRESGKSDQEIYRDILGMWNVFRSSRGMI